MRTAIATTAGVLLASLSCVEPVVAIGPIFGPPSVGDFIIFYDTDGNVGWVQERPDGYTGQQPTISAFIGGSGDFFIGGDFDNPLISFQGLSVGFDTGTGGIPPYPAGTPYYVRRYHPDLGCFSSMGYVGAQFDDTWPAIVIPISFSQYGIPNRVVPIEGGGAESLYISVGDVLVVEDPTVKSIGVASFNLFTSLPAIQRPLLDVTVEYLPGNTLTGTIHRRTDQYFDFIYLVWGDPNPNGADPNVFELGTPAPEGPVLVSFSYDGYTTDTITLNLEKRKAYYWSPVIKATTGPTVSGYNPNAGILDQGVADALLGECNPSATLRTAWDPNSDGKTDAADFTTPDQQ